MIRSAVETGGYSDPAAEALLADVLIKRRDKIAAAYLPAINPLIDFTLSADSRLGFRNAAVDAHAGTAPTAGYGASWETFDNATGQTRPIGSTTSPSNEMSAPAQLPSTDGVYLRVRVSAVRPTREEWTRPVDVYFQHAGGRWRLVGLTRVP